MVEIGQFSRPKKTKRRGGGERQLDIPTVVDRLIRQAITQVLDPILDPTFSGSSFVFRPGRSAHDALHQAQGYVANGYEIVVDLDLKKFFDRVNPALRCAWHTNERLES